MTNVANINGKKIMAAVLRDRAAAKRWAFGCVESRMVILGDDGQFWVVRPVDGNRLILAGYELAR